MSLSDSTGQDERPVTTSVMRGIRRRCPRCGDGGLFSGYLRPKSECPACGEAVGKIMAHDAPPYITIMIVGHIIVPLLLVWEKASAPPIWLHMAVWLPATLILSLALLPFVKGGWIGLMWALRLTGEENQ